MSLLKELLQQTSGYKTYIAAVALAVMAILAAKNGDWAKAGELAAAALAAVGLRAALPTTPPAVPVAPTTPQPPAGTVTPNVLGSNVSITSRSNGTGP